MCDALRVLAFALGGLGDLLLLAAAAFLLVGGNGVLGDIRRAGEIGTQFGHLRAGVVNLHELLRREQSLRDHRAIDEDRARLGRRGDVIATIKVHARPIPPDAARLLLRVVGVQRSELPGVEVQRLVLQRRLFRRLRWRRKWTVCRSRRARRGLRTRLGRAAGEQRFEPVEKSHRKFAEGGRNREWRAVSLTTRSGPRPLLTRQLNSDASWSGFPRGHLIKTGVILRRSDARRAQAAGIAQPKNPVSLLGSSGQVFLSVHRPVCHGILHCASARLRPRRCSVQDDHDFLMRLP